jgi:N-methylhydantoinase B
VSDFDPIALEIARHRLQSIAEETGGVLIRTSFSPNIKDRRDCSTGIYSPAGELVAQAEHIPLHLGLMPGVVRSALEVLPLSECEPGDVLMTNDPFIGGSHLPDICLISPIFVDDRPIAIAANLAHHVDVGGMSPGGIPVGAHEIFQEGLRIPPIKLQRAGVLDERVLELLLANVRTTGAARGDLTAQLAANSLAERRLLELYEEWGPQAFQHNLAGLLEYGERRARDAIAGLPHGTAEFTDYLEATGTEERDVAIHAKVTVDGSGIEVDLTGTDPQVAGTVNCGRGVTVACATFVVRALTDPTLPANAGAMRPISVVTTPGTLVDAVFPAAVSSGNINTAQRIVDALMGAFAQLVPDRVPAASSGSMSILTIGGVDPETGGYFSYVETYGGGQGAHGDIDGLDGVHTNMTNTRNTPCEVIELEYPLRVRRYGLLPDTGGAGEHRGGSGLVRELELVRGTARASVVTERRKRRPWGLQGGGPGASSRVLVAPDGGAPAEVGAMTEVALGVGQRLVIETPGGGGYGDPSLRDPAAAERDALDGLVTPGAPGTDHAAIEAAPVR